MTTMAALMGTLPIALGVGAGSESRGRWVGGVGGLLCRKSHALYHAGDLFFTSNRCSNGSPANSAGTRQLNQKPNLLRLDQPASS